MMTLDFQSVSEAEAREQIAARCAEFGTATVLKVEFPNGRSGEGAAVIRMSAYEDATRLVTAFGGSRCGTKVIIRLFQEGADIASSSSRKNQVFDTMEEARNEIAP
jgi:hypothetical protein